MTCSARPLAFILATLVVLTLALSFAAPMGGCKYHPQDPTSPAPVEEITPAEVARRICSVAESVARIYPDAPEIGAVSGAIAAAAGLVETGDYRAAGLAIIELAKAWPAYREYALLASIALELILPGPGEAPTAKAAGPSTWSEIIKVAVPATISRAASPKSRAKLNVGSGESNPPGVRVGVKFENAK